jgi:hypothetical protein
VTISGDIGAEMRTYLLTQSGVSSLASTRVYPDALPLNYNPASTGPAVLYQRISAKPTASLDAYHDEERVRIQYDCYASTRTIAHQLGRAIQAALEAKKRGVLTTLTIDEITIDGGITDHAEPPPDGSDLWFRIASLDCVVFYH